MPLTIIAANARSASLRVAAARFGWRSRSPDIAMAGSGARSAPPPARRWSSAAATAPNMPLANNTAPTGGSPPVQTPRPSINAPVAAAAPSATATARTILLIPVSPTRHHGGRS